MTIEKMIDKTDILYWLPLVEKVKIPFPKTCIVSMQDPLEAYKVLDSGGAKCFWDYYKTRFKEAADEIGFPLFLRTSHFSGKHSFLSTCFIPNWTSLPTHLMRLIDESGAADFSMLPITCFALREYLQPFPGFLAFNGLPIGKERRWFVNNGKILCHHPYWPQEAFLRRPPDVGWLETLRRVNKESLKEKAILRDYSLRFASITREYFSIDYFCDASGKWWLIDMAEGERSWHPKSCSIIP